MENILIQAIGVIGLIFLVVLFHNQSRQKMLKLQLAASVCYALHFLLLGAMTGAALNGATVFRNYIFAQKNTHKWASSRWWLYLFIGIYCLLMLATWGGIVSILPAIGMITGTIAFWCSRPKTIRLLSLISPPLWFTYNFISGSYPGMLAELLIFISILLAIYRLDLAPSVTQSKNKLV